MHNKTGYRFLFSVCTKTDVILVFYKKTFGTTLARDI